MVKVLLILRLLPSNNHVIRLGLEPLLEEVFILIEGFENNVGHSR